MTTGRPADACGEVPRPDLVAHAIARLRRIGYLERFGGYLRQLGFTPAERTVVSGLDDAQIRRLVDDVGEREGWVDDPVRHARASDVSPILVVGEDTRALGLEPPDLHDLLDFYAGLTVDVGLFVGVDPRVPGSLDRGLAVQDHPCVVGLSATPFYVEAPIDDPCFEPLLDVVTERGIPLWVHGSGHYRPGVPYDVGHPRHIDSALNRWPGARVVIGHAGWPWTADACLVALRHPSVALEFSTFPPHVIADPGWGLRPLISMADALHGRIFFGSGVVSDPDRFARLIHQLEDLPLTDAQRDGWRGDGLRSWLSWGRA